MRTDPGDEAGTVVRWSARPITIWLYALLAIALGVTALFSGAMMILDPYVASNTTGGRGSIPTDSSDRSMLCATDQCTPSTSVLSNPSHSIGCLAKNSARTSAVPLGLVSGMKCAVSGKTALSAFGSND